MSFGPSGQEKGAMSGLQSLISQLGGLGTDSASRAGTAFGGFRKAFNPALNYWRGIMKGDRTQISQEMGPEITQINAQADQQLRALGESGRSGASSSAGTAVETGRSANIGNLILGARPAAAQQLTGLSQIAGGVAGQQEGLAESALSGAMSGTTSEISILDQWRQQENQSWMQLGQGIAGLGLGLLGPGISKWFTNLLNPSSAGTLGTGGVPGGGLTPGGIQNDMGF